MRFVERHGVLGWAGEPKASKPRRPKGQDRRIDKGRSWVKLSGACADTKVGPPSCADPSAVARAYVKAAPERLAGQRLPHPSERMAKPDDTALFDLLLDWAPDEKVCNRIRRQCGGVLRSPKTG